jgi:hypothetical protein
MRIFTCTLILCSSLPIFAAGPLADAFKDQFSGAERDVVSLAEAMPADKFNFVPTNGEFKGVRTFATQAKHIATINYQVASAILSEKPPVDIGSGDNGPDALKTKAEIVNYLKGSMAYSHKAIQTLTDKNQLDSIRAMGGPAMPRIAAASMLVWHTFDHYGQMVVYARMNGIVPPASQQAPPDAGKKDGKKK